MKPQAPLFGIRPAGTGRYLLEGDISFASVEAALKQTAQVFSRPEKITFDLAGIRKTDSAGLALLLEWLRQAGRGGGELHFVNFPRQLLAMAQVVGVDGMLVID